MFRYYWHRLQLSSMFKCQNITLRFSQKKQIQKCLILSVYQQSVVCDSHILKNSVCQISLKKIFNGMSLLRPKRYSYRNIININTFSTLVRDDNVKFQHRRHREINSSLLSLYHFFNKRFEKNPSLFNLQTSFFSCRMYQLKIVDTAD